jgi:hypothetical protein
VSWPALCRECGLAVGHDAWCDGHAGLATELLAWAAGLPAWWGDAVVLAWVTTGEVGWDGTTPTGLPETVREALPAGEPRG